MGSLHRPPEACRAGEVAADRLCQRARQCGALASADTCEAKKVTGLRLQRNGGESAEMSESNVKTYAIVGAAGGIGSALSRRLAAAGARVVLGGRRLEPLEELAEEIGGTALEVDGRDFEQVEQFLAGAAEAGDLKGVVNCAGSILLKPAHLTTRSELDETLATNLTTAFATVRAAAKILRRGGGSVVLIASAAAMVGLPNHEAIAAAKAAVAGLVRSAAATYAGRGIRINAVAPGLVDTPLSARIVENERALEASLRLHALPRVGTPQEVASLIAWLLGSESEWVTGQILHIDGGLAHLKARSA